MSVDQLAHRPPHGKKATARQRIAARRAEEAATRARAARRRRTLAGAIVGSVLLVAAVVLAIVAQSYRTSSSPDAAVPANTVDGGTAIEVGRADAPVTFDVYEDFQCPACARFEALDAETIAQLVADGSARVRYHPMAFLDQVSPDRYSTRSLNAAGVVVDAAGPEAFVRFAGMLYERQPVEGTPGLTDDELIALAGRAGASGADVERGIRDLVYEDWTRTVTDQASRDGVTSTPTVLLDGELLGPAQLQPAALVQAVRAGA
ncbi:DsbA family protein [Blastococcus saxobsidens]|uniref:DSBA oxidoreductase n=1 Tax=Blastococcus saxobsidens (strain DD2) TaxID=1146883 RepID=H6RU57_BLASD|nr:thioredoxin domain-containing protein [Blastococcus saxobsidens]CCG05664.1 DSBA oxidoreductase [Blastococcus saxobsidens DD2]